MKIKSTINKEIRNTLKIDKKEKNMQNKKKKNIRDLDLDQTLNEGS